MRDDPELATALAGRDEGWHPSWARGTQKAIRRLAKHEVTTIGELLLALPELPAAVRREAVYLLGRLGRKRDAGVLIKQFDAERSSAVRQAIVEALGQIGGKRACKALASWVADAKHPTELRCAACHALMSFFDQPDPTLLDTLLRVAASKQEEPVLRGQALEAIQSQVALEEVDAALWRRIIDLLFACLQDPSGEVRFWAIFAVGQVRAKQLVPELRWLEETDDVVGPLGWENREEARDMIHYLTTGESLEPDAYERMVASRSTASTNSSDS